MPTTSLRTIALSALLVLTPALLGACGSSTSASVRQLDAPTTTVPTDGAPTTTTTTEPEAGLGSQYYVYTPVVGDCIDRRAVVGGVMTNKGSATTADASLRAEGQVIVRFDCFRPHEYEVILFDTSEVNRVKPQTPDAYADLAKRICPAAFPAYIGRNYQDSSLEFGWIAPTDEQRSRGIEFLGCTVFDPKGRLVDSVRGANR